MCVLFRPKEGLLGKGVLEGRVGRQAAGAAPGAEGGQQGPVLQGPSFEETALKWLEQVLAKRQPQDERET